MAYATTNPPVLLVPRMGSGTGTSKGTAIWAYQSADAVATVKGAAYISNGDALGMKVGDIILISDTATPLASIGIVDAVAAGAAAELT